MRGDSHPRDPATTGHAPSTPATRTDLRDHVARERSRPQKGATRPAPSARRSGLEEIRRHGADRGRLAGGPGRGGVGHGAARFSGCRRGSVSGPGDGDPHTHVCEESGHQLPPAGQRHCAMTLQESGAGTGRDGRGCQDAELAFGRPVARPDAAERRARKQSGRQTACGAHVANRTLIVPSQVSVYVGRQDFGGSSYHYANFT